MNRGFLLVLLLSGILTLESRAQEKSIPAQDQPRIEQHEREQSLRRDAAIAEFTRKMKDANYPALFDQAAAEFHVPPDILKGIAFAETRWEHLTWPPGETVSPETGMPRPFGIMSLWDNQYFGHSLTEAAQLISRDPDELKTDPLQNIRGAAALLRKLYDQTPRPDGSTEAQIESWRYAVRVYCGIPEPDLNAQHALDIYTFISRGYHEYGVEWEGRPVNLDQIREETRRVVADERAKREMLRAPGATSAQGPATSTEARAGTANPSGPANAAPEHGVTAASEPTIKPSLGWRWILLTGLFVLAAILFALYRKQSRLHK